MRASNTKTRYFLVIFYFILLLLIFLGEHYYFYSIFVVEILYNGVIVKLLAAWNPDKVGLSTLWKLEPSKWMLSLRPRL